MVEANRIAGNQYVGVHVYGRGSRALVQDNDICDNSLAAVVSEHEGVVQSSGNRIDGVHERDLALPSGAEASLDASGPPRTPAASSLLRHAGAPPPPPSRTKWTRLVHPSVLIGHVSSHACMRHVHIHRVQRKVAAAGSRARAGRTLYTASV